MMAVEDVADGNTTVNVPEVEVLSEPKSKITTVGLTKPAEEVVLGVVL